MPAWQWNGFEIKLTKQQVAEMSAAGSVDAAVEYWSRKVRRPRNATPARLRAELKEYGAWNNEELQDDAMNWQRILWITAGNIKEDSR